LQRNGTLVIKARKLNGEVKYELFTFQSENFIFPTEFIDLKRVIRTVVHFLKANSYLK